MQPTTANQRGQYGTPKDDNKKLGAGGIFLVLGIAVGIYALSPGARHWYKHGQLPHQRR